MECQAEARRVGWGCRSGAAQVYDYALSRRLLLLQHSRYGRRQIATTASLPAVARCRGDIWGDQRNQACRHWPHCGAADVSRSEASALGNLERNSRNLANDWERFLFCSAERRGDHG